MTGINHRLNQRTLKIGFAFFAMILIKPVMAAHKHINTHGDVVHMKQGHSSDVIVEKVKLYPRQYAQTEEIIERNGVLVRYKNAEANIVISHGFMCDKFDVAFLREMFPRGKYNFLTYDFRAHGENRDGQMCTFGRDEALDVIAAAKFIRNHPGLKGKPVYGYGFSMGAVSTIEAQAKDPSLFDGLILDCPFDSTQNILAHILDNLKVSVLGYQFDLPGKSILQKYAFHPYVQSFIKVLLKAVSNLDTQRINTQIYPLKPVESAKNIKVPCLFIHCKNDEKVSVAAVKSIYENVQAPKTLWLTNGRRHFDSFFYNPEQYANKVKTFVNELVEKKNKPETTALIIEDEDEMPELVNVRMAIDGERVER